MQYDLPDIGDQVLCLFLSYGHEQGFVIGAMYGKQTPPVQSGDKFHRTFSDGATIEYDRANHALKANIPGTVTITSSGPMTLEAPTIYIRGNLFSTGKDGNPGKAVFSGGMKVMDGGLDVPDGDIVAKGVSLFSHTHGDSPHPNGGGSVCLGTDTIASGKMSAGIMNAILEEKKADVKNRGTKVDNLIMCLPKIARAMAEECREEGKDLKEAGDTAGAEENENKAIAWEILAGFFERWTSGKPNSDAMKCSEPEWLDLDWLMKIPKFANAWNTFTAIPPIEGKRNILNEAAKQLLGERLCENDIFKKEEKVTFNFIGDEKNWKEWKKVYQNLYSVPLTSSSEFDGVTIALGSFTLLALASGTAERLSENIYKICVDEIAVVLWDSFNFEPDEETFAYLVHCVVGLGYWQCEPPRFDPFDFFGGYKFHNSDFREFRDRNFGGSDFMVLTRPRTIASFKGECYVYTCKK